MTKPIAWIKDALKKEGNTKGVYSRYEEFKKYTGSKMLAGTFERLVRKVQRQLKPIISGGDVQVKRSVSGPDTTIVTTSHEIRTLEQLLMGKRKQ